MQQSIKEQEGGSRGPLWGQILYGSLFLVVLPLFLLAFTVTVEITVRLDRYPAAGGITAVAGFLLMARGMAALIQRGQGLPMNPFPPKKLVLDGIYAWVPHPIYFGFVLLVLGLSLLGGSATGAFLTTPLTAAGAMALAVGHENIKLLQRFGSLPSPALGYGKLAVPVLGFLGLLGVWKHLLKGTEVLANSWKSYHFGPVRVISHFWFSGLAGGTGAFLAVLMAGRDQSGTVALLMLAGILGAALFGQLLVGRFDGLSRPFGYFGGVLGIVAGGMGLSLFRQGIFSVLTAFCLAGPWAQAIGRLRCIVQGCCHGMPAGESRGIVVHNRHSRACHMAGLCGRPIYPTQLYSSIGNLLLGLLLWRAFRGGASMTLISGLYLTLAGAIRFTEEGYRGEPMTQIVAGLRIYQWFAAAMFVAGMLVMMFPAAPVNPVDWESLPLAALAGLVFFIGSGTAMSVDFPEARARFTRLSG